MRGRLARFVALSALVLLQLRGAAWAETAQLRIVRPLDLVALPLLIMEHQHLIERTAEAMGLGEVAVTWTTPEVRGAGLAAVAAGQSDLAASDVAPFLFAADATAGAPNEIKAVGALAQRPYVLVTRNPAVRTIRDFGNVDRIAVPELKTSGPVVMLQMAVAQEWGTDHYARLDPIMLARPDMAAAETLLSGKGEIDAHFSRTPFSDGELGNPAVHRVMDSFDIAGPHSAAVLVTTAKFRADNPTLSAAILSALQEAGDLIKDKPGEAAEIYSGMVKDQDIPLEDLADMIGDPDLAYTAAPVGIMRLADFVAKTGRLKHHPAAWQDLFLPEAHDLKGN